MVLATGAQVEAAAELGDEEAVRVAVGGGDGRGLSEVARDLLGRERLPVPTRRAT